MIFFWSNIEIAFKFHSEKTHKKEPGGLTNKLFVRHDEIVCYNQINNHWRKITKWWFETKWNEMEW